ncbi:response regulator transcription factor [Paraburkholderia rhizosphaerae]|uniref:Response regulator receiver domain-containing protein n=1 Tax=Paraburkholderia rhizosphaerae TaxID=480658 RepID=A0A4R8LCF4_9BURK|nr:response regulator [Paraburkholderia rhizosphaerae]TDY40577.1 response regulator receiver domain-containing protein [Paraburkholderia rhizosphaerae]
MIAVIDDDASVREAVKSLITSQGLPVRSYSSAEQFLASSDFHLVTCVVTDIKLEGMSGMQLQHYLRAARCPAPVILMTAYFDESTRGEATAHGAAAYLVKPFSGAELLGEIEKALSSRESP